MKNNFSLLLLISTILLIRPAEILALDGPNAFPEFVGGLAQRVEAFSDPDTWIRHDLWVETEFDIDGDGRPDRMHVSVTRPPQTDEGLQLPVVFQSSPYYAGRSSTDRRYFWDVRQELYTEPVQREFPPAPERTVERPVISSAMIDFWVPRGFIAVHSSAPGTGYSQGCPTIGTEIEALAPKAVIDWLNGRAKGYTSPFGEEEVAAYWTTGKVGMIGTSYNGTLALAAASTGVDGLEAIIPVAPNTSYYHYYRSNGLIVHPYGWMGEDIDFLYDFVHSNPDNRDYCNLTFRDTEMAEGMDRVTGNYNDFWAKRDLAANLENVEAAVLMAHAFNDWNVMPGHSYRVTEVLKEMGVPHQIYYHQGGHGGNPPEDMMIKWFTRYLFGEENGVEDDPVAWIVREDDNRLEPTPYEDYPNPGASVVEFFLRPGAPEAGLLVLGKETGKGSGSGSGTETLTDNFSFSGSALAQAELTGHRLLYVTPELEEDLHISGVPSVTIRLSVDRPAANLSVWLVSLPWNEGRNARITDNIITRGWADPQNRNSITESEPLEPGKFYDVTFDLEPDDQVISAGQQIGLMIFSSDKDFTLWPDPGAQLTVDLDGTTLRLPVVGGGEAIRFKKPGPPEVPGVPENAHTPEEILSGHPRILLFEGEEELIKKSVEANPVWKEMHEAILNESDAIISLSPVKRELTGRRLLGKSREALRRIFYLSYSYRMAGEDKYFQRAEEEMLAIAGFDDWNPSHFLDVAEMTMAMAIGYDWLCHELSPGSREIIREAILKKGLEPSFDPEYNWFLNSEHNWNQVCNAGMTYGAIAVYEYYPELASEIIDRAFNTITLAKADYEPDGAYPEGYGYWGYGTSFNVMFLSAVDKIWPGRFNYDDYPAFVETGSFVKNMLAPSGNSFNWGDNGPYGHLNPSMFWFAEKNNQSSLLWMEKSFLDRYESSRFVNERLLPAIMLWGKDIPFGEIVEPDYRLYVAQGKMPLALMRTSWTDPSAIYLGFKGGSPSVNHGHMDVGSFVFESDGVRWGIDLGAQGYNSLESLGMNIWGTEQDAERWTVYRLNNFSHSTLTVNGELQRVDGYSKIDRYSDDPGFSFGISDISSLYSTTLETATRGAGIVDGNYMVIRDELSTGAEPAVVRWQMLTGADVTITGNNSATLALDGRTLDLRIDSPRNVKVTTWSSQPGTEWDVDNPGTILVGFEVTVPANSREALDVKFIPGSSNTDASFNRKLEEW